MKEKLMALPVEELKEILVENIDEATSYSLTNEEDSFVTYAFNSLNQY